MFSGGAAACSLSPSNVTPDFSLKNKVQEKPLLSHVTYARHEDKNSQHYKASDSYDHSKSNIFFQINIKTRTKCVFFQTTKLQQNGFQTEKGNITLFRRKSARCSGQATF